MDRRVDDPNQSAPMMCPLIQLDLKLHKKIQLDLNVIR